MTGRDENYYRRALTRIPWATQTHAKRWNPDWGGFMPAFIQKASGCRMWDLGGREYIDYRCALGPIILGYRFPAVVEAVRRQLNQGVLFSMASPLELETAEAVIVNVPWIEQIRFMKTGADACTACVRLARVYTGRQHILSSGYHGYHDLFAAGWENSGVPPGVRQTIHEIPYGDLEAVKQTFRNFGDNLAAAIVSPYEWNEDTGVHFLQELRQRCTHSGVVLIFDEVLTGFRLARGGAREFYGITPDLAAFGKAIANGYPLSAFAGKQEFMQVLDKTIITSTYAGETLSLAAGKATMNIIREEPVHDHIWKMGKRLKDGFTAIVQEFSLPARAAGLEPAPFIQFKLDDEQANRQWQNRLFSLLFEQGIFPNERWFINYSHQARDIDETLDKMRAACKRLLERS